MQIYGRTQPLSHYPILEGLGVLKRLGFDGVELCLENPDLSPELLTPELVAQVAGRLRELSFASYSIGYHKDYIYDDSMMEATRRAIVTTPTFGTRILVFGGTPTRAADGEWERMIERTRELVALAEEHDVILAQEFEPGFIVGSTADLLRMFEAIPSDHLAANLDLGHAFLCDPDPLASIRTLGPKIVHCHIENMARGVHNHRLPHDGDMDLRAYLRALAEIGFTGGMALDLYAHDYEAVAPSAIAYLRDLIDALKLG